MNRRAIVLCVCLALAALLGWSGAAKALDPAAFAEAILGFRLVPHPVAVALALYLPWLELFVAAALLVPRWRAGALWVAAVLLALFALLWAVTWLRGLDVSCGCFGGQGRSSAAWSLARAALLAAASWFALFLSAPNHRRPPAGPFVT